MGTITEKILEILQMQAENAVDLLDIVLSDRSTSYRKARRSMLYGPPQFKTDWAELYRKRRAFHSLLNKLKREGFIVRPESKRNSSWRITRRGLERLKVIKSSKKDATELVKHEYERKNSRELSIIAFDVPEKERSKRNWLRAELVALGFKKLQNSVWAGKIKIPTEFIRDLKDNGILSCVHIFSVGRMGTIEEGVFS